MRLKKQIAILALGAGFAGCTPQPATNLIEDNMEFEMGIRDSGKAFHRLQ